MKFDKKLDNSHMLLKKYFKKLKIPQNSGQKP